MIPVYIFVAILKQTPVFDYLGAVFQPYMKYLGLPGEAALAIVTGTVVNLYASAAVLADLNLTAREITIVALILGISHSQIMETAIVSRMRAKPLYVTAMRVVFSLFAGFVLNLVWPA